MARLKALACQQCGGEMQKKTLTAGCAMTLLCLGLMLLFPVGTIIGAIILQRQKRRVWKCQQCGTVIDRA